MSSSAPVKLSVLRDIGWREWDPIGLADPRGAWKGLSCADEYDTYLIAVAGRLQKGATDTSLVAYLVQIETEHMGLDPRADTAARAIATVAAFREYLITPE